MHYGRTLLAGLGWAGTLGALALCVLIFLCAYLTFDDDRSGVRPRTEGAVRLPSVSDAEIPRVRLARPPSRGNTTLGEVDAVRPEANQDTGGAASLIPPPPGR